MTEFDTYQDTVISRVEDPRSLNVVERIKQGNSRSIVHDETTENGELQQAITHLRNILTNQINTSVGTVASTLSTLSNTVTNLGPKRVYTVESITGISGEITTADLYNSLKTTLLKGDICIGEITLTDGPTTNLSMLAYCTDDNITVGEDIVSLVYIILSSATISPYIWWYNAGVWNSMMLSDNKSFILQSSTAESTKKYKISVDDAGTITATEII